MDERKAKAETLRKLVRLLLELADVTDYNNGLLEAVGAWEREYELLTILWEYMRCNDTAKTKERAKEILRTSGYFESREKQLLTELGYAAV